MADYDVTLVGAPDSSLGSPQSTSKTTSAIQIDLTNDMLEELLQCVRNGKPPQILFGGSPSIRYDGKSRALHTTPEKFRHELYTSSQSGKQEWAFAGVVNHTMSVAEVDAAASGMDLALETLKNRVAAERIERENNKTILRTPELSATKRKVAANKAAHPNLPLKATSLKSASLLTPSASSPSYLSPPKSASLDDTMFEAANHPSREPLVHLLAAEPKTFSEAGELIYGKTWKLSNRHSVYKKLWALVAQPVKADEPDGPYTLSNKMFKEVKPYETRAYQNQPELQKKAVDNAIKAFDRQRLGKTDPLWQQLLPKEDRGKGICLSRLNIVAPQARTPLVAPSKNGKKTGPPKKLEPKKSKLAEESDKEKVPIDAPKKAVPQKGVQAAAKDSLRAPGKDSPRHTGRSAGTPLAKPIRSTEGPEPTKGASARADHGATSKSGTMQKAAQSPLQKPAKASANAKSFLNKPRNPSPLSRSPPVNASDFKDDHPVHKKLSAAVSPSGHLKRKADSDIDAPSKRQHVTSSSSSGSSSAERPKPKRPVNGMTTATGRERELANARHDTPVHSSSLKRKAGATDLDSDYTKSTHVDDHTPNKVRKTLPASQDTRSQHQHHREPTSTSYHARADKTPPSTSSDADEDGPIRLTWKQAVVAAQRFEKYYPKYKRRWEELCGRDKTTPPSQKEREQFMVMHRKIEEMKRQIREAVARGKDGERGFD